MPFFLPALAAPARTWTAARSAAMRYLPRGLAGQLNEFSVKLLPASVTSRWKTSGQQVSLGSYSPVTTTRGY